MFHREHRRRARGDADLRVDVLDVVFGRTWRDHKRVGDLAIRGAACDEAYHLHLPVGET